jgi:GGDEF domain-containing protein
MSPGKIDIGLSSSCSAPDELYRSLVDAMEEGVVVQDMTGHVVAYNRGALEALGLSASQLLGTDITEVKEAEQRQVALARTDSLTGVPNVRVIRERLGLMCEVACILQSNVRATDMVGRWGGEEFCVLLADVDEQSAVRIADELRLALHEIQFPCPVTASFGVALLSVADSTLEQTMERADRALYCAKQKGRDRVEPAMHPPGSHLLLGSSWRGSRSVPA